MMPQRQQRAYLLLPLLLQPPWLQLIVAAISMMLSWMTLTNAGSLVLSQLLKWKLSSVYQDASTMSGLMMQSKETEKMYDDQDKSLNRKVTQKLRIEVGDMEGICHQMERARFHN